MRLEPGSPAPDFRATAMDGGSFDTGTLRGRRWLLGFHRYAT
jgi:peroxiredoxin